MKEQPRHGDIVLYSVTGQSEDSSKLVATAELWFGRGRSAARYSHVGIRSYSPGRNYESRWPVSGLFDIDPHRSYDIVRIEGMSDDQLHEVVDDCARHSGEWYPLDTLVTFGLIRHKNMKVCSQWAAARFAKAGVHFHKEGMPIVSPDAIADFKTEKYQARVIYRHDPGRSA